MKIRKDKTNTAVYEAMRHTLNHPQTQKILNLCDTGWLKTHREGFDMKYMSAEHRLNQFFITTWATMVTQLEDKFEKDRAEEIRNRLKKVFCCKGLAYNSRNSYQCHHPLCPMCYHRKHYRTINDLEPYLDEKNNDLYVIQESEFVPFDQVRMAMLALEQRAKKITGAISKHVEQWIRLPRIQWDEKSELFEASFIILAVGKKKNTTQIMREIGRHSPIEPCKTRFTAMSKNLAPIAADILGYDPLVLKYGGSQAMEEWDRKTPGFSYRAKVAHR